MDGGGDAMNRVSTDVFAYDRTVNIIQREEQRGTVTIMDMTGRVVQTAALNGLRTAIATDVTTGIYVVRVETGRGVESRKVIIN
jgi:hypothetical protein